MTRTHRGNNGKRRRRISVRAVRRNPPDVTKLSRALVLEALQQAAAEAEAEQQAANAADTPRSASDGANHA